MSSDATIAVFRDMIRSRVIEVRPDGTIWKLRNLNTTPLREPRRLETCAKSGYFIVKVCSNSEQYAMSAHRLVWTVLVGPIPDGLEPNHKDGNKHNNRLDNLELVTRGENHRHAWQTGLRRRSTLPADIAPAAKALRADGLSFSQIAERLGVSQTTAFRACDAEAA